MRNSEIESEGEITCRTIENCCRNNRIRKSFYRGKFELSRRITKFRTSVWKWRRLTEKESMRKLLENEFARIILYLLPWSNLRSWRIYLQIITCRIYETNSNFKLGNSDSGVNLRNRKSRFYLCAFYMWIWITHSFRIRNKERKTCKFALTNLLVRKVFKYRMLSSRRNYNNYNFEF